MGCGGKAGGSGVAPESVASRWPWDAKRASKAAESIQILSIIAIMKPVISALLSTVALWATAQAPYRPFPESNAGWVEEHSSLDGFNDWTTCVRTVRFAGDTAIGGITYHQLRSSGSCTWFNIFNSMYYGAFTEPEAVFAMFRQDTVARKVFAYDLLAQQEVLWFDFSLGLGEYPVTLDYQFSFDSVQVVALDSMELSDGYHRTWVLGAQMNGMTYDSAYCTVIEGVGSTYGLHPINGLQPPFEWSDALTCHSEGGEGIYPYGGPACYLSMSVAEHKPEHADLVIYPNPAGASIIIKGTWLPDAHYVIVDLLGAEVRNGLLCASTIELTGLGVGLYTIRMMDVAGNDLGTARLLKE